MTKEQVLEKLRFDVELRGLSKHTQEEYYSKCKIFQNHFNKPATELGEKDIREFLHFLTTEKKLASGSVNTYNSGLRFLYGVTLDTSLNNKQIPRHRRHRKFPNLLTQEEIVRRRDVALLRALSTPHKRQSEMKIGSAAKRGAHRAETSRKRTDDDA